MIRVIAGHICSGKSWHVRENAKPGDVVIDLDRLALAMSVEGTNHHDYPQHIIEVARAARWYAMDKAAALHKFGAFDVWIIHAYPTPNDLAIYRRAGATIKYIETDNKTLLDRAKNQRPPRAVDELVRRLSSEASV